MIIKGKSRSGPSSLAAHLGNAEKNERVQLLETRGTIAQDLRGALVEIDAYAAGTRCEKPLYHAAMSPEPPHRLTPEQRSEAVDALEVKMGLVGHSRVVVLHEKMGREHIHVVWSRIDLAHMKSVSDSHNYRRHEEVARDLERRFGHERVQGAHHERDGVQRPDRTPSRAELRQEERSGIKGKDVKAEVTALFQKSDGPDAFRSALAGNGYILAEGDRRDFVIVDRAGGVHSLAKRIDNMKVAALREFMEPMDRNSLPSVEEAKDLARQARDARDDAQLEKSYSHGDGYVSQSQAAQKESERRQDALNASANRDTVWDKIEAGEKRLETPTDPQPAREVVEGRDDGGVDHQEPAIDEAEIQRRDQQRRLQQEADSGAGHSKAAESAPSATYDQYEITDRMAQLLADLDDDESLSRDDDVDRTREAPGGGRTRSR